ncbi:MAG: MoaD/ThiS family protein [Clostridia bacterium]|nr:MoaD/ThiS family protein [Clostridia bacterium]
MRIQISVTSWFKRFTDGIAEMEIEVSDGAAAVEAVLKTGIPLKEIGFVTVNDMKVDMDHLLHEGDRLRAYPTIIGG